MIRGWNKLEEWEAKTPSAPPPRDALSLSKEQTAQLFDRIREAIPVSDEELAKARPAGERKKVSRVTVGRGMIVIEEQDEAPLEKPVKGRVVA